jgi:hypothetical protein
MFSAPLDEMTFSCVALLNSFRDIKTPECIQILLIPPPTSTNIKIQNPNLNDKFNMPSNQMTHKRMQSAGPQYIHEINNENTHLNPWSSNRKISCADKFYDWSSMQSSTKQPPLLVFLQDKAADKYTHCIVIICLHFVSTRSTLQQAAQPHEHVAQLAK